MKLYASPLACSGAVQMILLEFSIPHSVEFVDIYTLSPTLIGDGTLYAEVNPKDAVPALKLDSGELLTEVGVILQYVADLRPESGLLPKLGSMARYRVMEWLSYVGSDVHKTLWPLFNPHMPEPAKVLHRQNLQFKLDYIEWILANQPYLAGETFTVADAYLFVMIGWKPFFKFDLLPYPNLKKFQERISERPSFARMLETVGPALECVNPPVFPKQGAGR